MKRALILLLTVLFILIFTFPTTLADTSEWDYYQDVWEVISTSSQGATNNGHSYVVWYQGPPCEQAGEVYHFSKTVSYADSISGGVNVSISEINAEFSFNFQSTQSFTVTKDSAPLLLGQYIVISLRNNYEKYKVNQALIRSGYMVDYDENMNQIGYRYVRELLGDESTAYVYRPIMPQIQMKYYMDDGSNSRSGDTLVKTEYYTFVNGSWKKH